MDVRQRVHGSPKRPQRFLEIHILLGQLSALRILRLTIQ